MSVISRGTLGLIFLTLMAAALGGWLGVSYGLQKSNYRPSIDDIVHHELQLTPEQMAQIETLEKNFAVRRQALLTEMRAADIDLAAAMKDESTYTLGMRDAVERFHKAMGLLQEETLRHVLTMRGVLTPEQTKKFDKLVGQTLASEAP